jgi:hypothetical protein
MSRLVVLPMRCAAKGTPFHAVFEWNDVRKKYVLLGTVAAAEGGSPTAGSSVEKLTQAAKPALTSHGNFTRSLIELVKGHRRGEGAETPQHPTESPQGPPTFKESPQEFNLKEFSFSGFSCPVCGYGEEHPLTAGVRYVKCGKCKRLVCGVGLSKAGDSMTFRCYDECGGGGTWDGGSGKPLTTSGILGESMPTSQAQAPAIRGPESRQIQGSTVLGLPPPDRRT